MHLEDREVGIRIDADFECGSSGEIRKLGELSYVAAPQPEPIPDWFYQALQEHFAGGGVPREYACHVRVTSSSPEPRRLTLRFVFSETNGKGYMEPPYWIFRARRWRPLPAAATRFVKEAHVDLEFDIDPQETVYVANKPYVGLTQVAEEMEDLTEIVDFFAVREIGRTAQDRPLLVLESEEREEKIVVSATLQPAEPAARPVLAVAHWLTNGSALTQRLLERFQFCFIPMPNPDGTALGKSVTNSLGEVPMFSFGLEVAGEKAPLETTQLWKYMQELRPTAYMEFHTHYQNVREHKLNPMALEWFPEHMQERVQRVDQALLETNAAWRVTPLDKALPLVDSGKFTNLTKYFQTLSYCYQIYAISEEATCAHATTAIATLAQALAGPEWLAQRENPRVERG